LIVAENETAYKYMERHPPNSIETEIHSNPDGTFHVSLSVPEKWEESGR